jgi:flagellar hook-length control protein FliK
VIARVVADHPSAAQTLQQAAGELRRALEGSGVSLLQLDIGASDHQPAGNAEHDESQNAASAGAAGEAIAEPEDGEETTTTTMTLASGSVVNVLA